MPQKQSKYAIFMRLGEGLTRVGFLLWQLQGLRRAGRGGRREEGKRGRVQKWAPKTATLSNDLEFSLFCKFWSVSQKLFPSSLLPLFRPVVNLEVAATENLPVLR